MIITFNCALDSMVISDKLDKAEQLFKEIDFYYVADYITYSTIIKGFSKKEEHDKAFSYLSKMLLKE